MKCVHGWVVRGTELCQDNRGEVRAGIKHGMECRQNLTNNVKLQPSSFVSGSVFSKTLTANKVQNWMYETISRMQLNTNKLSEKHCYTVQYNRMFNIY